MKCIVCIMLTALMGFTAGLYLPWWSIAVAAFIVAALIPQGAGLSFLAGFTGIFLLWGVLAWWIDLQNSSILSQKIARVLPMGGSVVSLLLLTAFLGALVAGFAALTGSYLRKLKTVE